MKKQPSHKPAPKSSATRGQPNKNARPRLRCPLCGKTTVMPASHCAHCRADFATGYRKPRFGIFGRLFRKTWGLLQGLLIMGSIAMVAAVIFWLLVERGKKEIPQMPIARDFQTIAEENPNLLTHYVMVYKARRAVISYNQSLYNRQGLIKNFSGDGGSPQSAKQRPEYIQGLNASEREQILNELFVILNNGQASNQDYIMSTPAIRGQLLKEMQQSVDNDYRQKGK